MSNVTSIKVEILEGNCGSATIEEIERYAKNVQEKLEELYPGATVETEIVRNTSGSGRAPLVIGGAGDEQDTVARVVQDVWKDGSFWSTEAIPLL